MPNDMIYSCYSQYKNGNCIASAANSCSNYYTDKDKQIDSNAEIMVWRKHSPQPYIKIRKDIKKDEEIVVEPYGRTFNYKL